MATRPKQYTRDDKSAAQVKTLSAMGLTVVEIASVIGMSQPTLQKYYQAELDIGHLEANAKVAAALFRTATDAAKPNVVACIFWLKCRAGWREDDLGRLSEREVAALMARAAAPPNEWDKLIAQPVGPAQDTAAYVLPIKRARGRPRKHY